MPSIPTPIAGRFYRFVAPACTVLLVAACASPEASAPDASELPSPTSAGGVPRDYQQVLAELAPGPGSGALALVQTPEMTWRGASGNASPDRLAEAGDRFGIASTTKTFVATVVLQLVGEGRLALDDVVESVLPGQVDGGERITIRQLLNHTSGIGGPVGRHHYANENYVILGHIVEMVTGAPLEIVVRDRILAPLDLENTTFGSASVGTEASKSPPWLGSEVFAPIGPVAGAQGMVSTADDLATFFKALLRGELLGEAELSEMLRTVEGGFDTVAGQIPAPYRAGLGMFELELPCGSPWGHGGDSEGYSNRVLVSRDGATIVVVAQNARNFPGVNSRAAEMYCLEG